MKYRLGSRDTVEKDIWSGEIDVEEEVRHLLRCANIGSIYHNTYPHSIIWSVTESQSSINSSLSH